MERTAKAEKDFWLLLEALDKHHLLTDLDDLSCDQSINEYMNSLSFSASLDEVLRNSLCDARIQKGKVVCDWLEAASRDNAVDCPVVRKEPWASTVRAVQRNGHTKIQGLHPDAQISDSGVVIGLVGPDRSDQESLLKYIWSFIRGGQLKAAQAIAEQHHVFWLAASLLGANLPETVVEAGSSDEDGGDRCVRLGNVRQPVWLRTCWRHADRLARNQENFVLSATPGEGETLAGVIEMTIYASFANHTKILLESPLVSTWSDRLWVVVKAAYEAELARVLHAHRVMKAERSNYFVGCDKQTLQAEEDLLRLQQASTDPMLAAAGGLGLVHGDFRAILATVPPPAADSPATRAEALLLQLQAAVIGGRSTLDAYIQSVILPELESQETFPGRDEILRVFCSLMLWLRAKQGTELPSLVSDEILHRAVEAHVLRQIANKKYTEVLPFLVHLCRARRMALTVELFNSVPLPALPLAGCSAQGLHSAPERNLDNDLRSSKFGESWLALQSFQQLDSSRSSDQAKEEEQRHRSRSLHIELMNQAHDLFPGDVLDSLKLLAMSSRAGSKLQDVLPATSSFVHPSRESSDELPATLQTHRRTEPEPATPSAPTPLSKSRLDFSAAKPTPFRKSVRDRVATPFARKSASAGRNTPGSAIRERDEEELGVVVYSDADAGHFEKKVSVRLSRLWVDALFWLFLRDNPSYRLEAYIECNRYFAHNFLCILPSYSHSSSRQELAAQLLKTMEDVFARYSREYICTTALNQALDETVLSTLGQENTSIWRIEVDKLLMWSRIYGSLKDLQLWREAATKFDQKLDSIIGSLKVVLPSIGNELNRLDFAAKQAIDSIGQSLNCARVDDFAFCADGIGELFANAEESCWVVVQDTLVDAKANILSLLKENSGAGFGGVSHRSGRSSLRPLPSSNTQLTTFQELSALAADTFSLQRSCAFTESGYFRKSTGMDVLSVLEEVGMLLSRLPLAWSAEATPNNRSIAHGCSSIEESDMLCSVEWSLREVIQAVMDLRQVKTTARMCVFQLLSWNLEIANGTAERLSNIQRSREAASWHFKSVQLADMIASDSYALRLHSLLHREHLKELLEKINRSAMLAVDYERI